MEIKVQGSEFKVQGSGFWVIGSWFMVMSNGFKPFDIRILPIIQPATLNPEPLNL
jgi:hypothetical protein